MTQQSIFWWILGGLLIASLYIESIPEVTTGEVLIFMALRILWEQQEKRNTNG